MLDKSINDGLLDGFVVVTLYTDDKGRKDGDSLTIGERNLILEKEQFHTDIFPVFFILDHKGNVIKGPKGYCSAEEFKKFVVK